MKKILAMVLTLMMLVSTVAYAAVAIDVPATLRVSDDAVTFVDSLEVEKDSTVAFRATLDMQPVRNAFLADYDATLAAATGASGTPDPAYEAKLRSLSVTGNWTLTLTYPNVLTIPLSVLNGTNMDGFNDNAKVIFEEVSRGMTPGDPNNTFTIQIKVKDGCTVGQIKDNINTALGNMVFTATDVVTTTAQRCVLVGTITGDTTISARSLTHEYAFEGYDIATNLKKVDAELIVVEEGEQNIPTPGRPTTTPDWPHTSSPETGTVADPEKTGVADILNVQQHIVYMEGYPDGTIRPEANVTRAEATTMLYRLLRPEVRDEIFTLNNNFGDVTQDLWYNKAVSSMAKGSYVNGYEDGNFYGDNNITRAELVAIVARFAKVEEGQVDFADVDASHWAYGYISTAVANGWIAGYEDGSFKPEQYITRAEAATVINRVLSRGVKNSGVIDGVKVWPDNPENEWYYFELVEATNEHTYSGTRPNEFWKTLHIDFEYDIVHYERP